jgi:hypothetical protein
MSRLLAIILLFTLLARLALAAPAGGIICYASNHVATTCHPVSAPTDCHPAATAGSDDTEDGDCIDLSTDLTSVREDLLAPDPVVAITDFGAPLRFAFVVSHPAYFEKPLTHAPPFSARDFTCSIALRC